jgi:hypothetical protein
MGVVKRAVKRQKQVVNSELRMDLVSIPALPPHFSRQVR